MKHPKTIILADKPHTLRSRHLADLVEAVRARPIPGVVYCVLVKHDSWCAFLASRGPCNCNPDIEMKG